MVKELNMDQILRFQADQITFEPCDDENVAHVFLRSTTPPQKHYLMINRSVDSRKKSEIFLEYDDQSKVARGGVAKCQLRDASLTLEIEEVTAEALGIPEVRCIIIDFDLGWAPLRELGHSLSAIFADFGVYEDRSQE
jgi:hypothetical protein